MSHTSAASHPCNLLTFRTGRMTSAIWLLLLAVAVVSSTWAQLNYLTERDFLNAARLPITTQRMRPLYNDLRFPIRRAKRGGGVGVASESDKWPNGRVPYVLSAAYNENQRAVIARAIAGYQAKTCIRFVPKTPLDRDYVVISKLDGCYADFARVGGRQQVSLADECIDYATIIHEFMHVIGANSDFDKLSQLDLSYYGESYDYLSIMHYESNEGSKNGRNTIEAKTKVRYGMIGANSDFDKLSQLDLSYYGEGYDYLSIMHYESNEGSKNGRNTIEAKSQTITFIRKSLTILNGLLDTKQNGPKFIK
ncbi:astacin [Ancylostoma duodenale]|uniref:Metalloendopeptidase n=1 Tax=Ancylostoma duodenale TaxID=51022 RepID=A0A0C2GQ49_9BILA|nr:astacin [Ancylostoma duodenale]